MLLVSILTGKKFGNHYSILTCRKTEQNENSVTLLTSIGKVRSQGKPLAPKLERPTDNYRESQSEQKPPWGPGLMYKNLNYSGQIARGSLWASLRD